jgi:hypothetical protein
MKERKRNFKEVKTAHISKTHRLKELQCNSLSVGLMGVRHFMLVVATM